MVHRKNNIYAVKGVVTDLKVKCQNWSRFIYIYYVYSDAYFIIDGWILKYPSTNVNVDETWCQVESHFYLIMCGQTYDQRSKLVWIMFVQTQTSP